MNMNIYGKIVYSLSAVTKFTRKIFVHGPRYFMMTLATMLVPWQFIFAQRISEKKREKERKKERERRTDSFNN